MLPQSGDLLFAREAPVGPIVRIPETGNVAPGQRTMLLRPDPALVNTNFLYYLLTSPVQQERLLALATGSTVAHLNVADVRAFQLPTLPSVGQQRAIAEVLGALDDKIAANTKLAATAEALGRAQFRNAISGPNAVSVQLGDVAKNVAGKYLAKDDYVSDGPYFIYGSNSIMGRHDKALNQGGFAVLAKIGSYCGNLRWSQRPAWVNNNASAIVPAKGMAPALLRHAVDLIEMAPHKAGTGQPYIRMESLFSSEITVPGFEAAAAIAPVLEDLSELEARSGEENTTLTATRDALLPQLMSGKLRVKDAEKVLEVAGV